MNFVYTALIAFVVGIALTLIFRIPLEVKLKAELESLKAEKNALLAKIKAKL